MLVLAGGFGSRLRSIVSDVPKPLAPVCGEPFLSYLIENYIIQGAREFVFLLHYEAKLIESMIKQLATKKNFSNVKMTYIYENKPLGTGGSIKNAIKILNISEPFIAINGDTWLSTGFDDVASSRPNSLAAVNIADCARYGTLVVKNNIVTAFLEKNVDKGEGLINAGLYHLAPDVFSSFADRMSFSLEKEVLPKISEYGGLEVVRLYSEFIDIGVPHDYLRFCEWICSGKTIEL